jgi:membrane protease YdiL (CAAX protease family)
MLDMIPLTIIMHWIYNHTNRSTLSAAFVHFSGNMCGALLIKSDRLSLLELVCLSLVAIAIVVQTRGKLGYQG